MMVARLHNNGCEVRVDMGNTGKNWPDCDNEQKGFPWLTFGAETWLHAMRYAYDNGATEIAYSGNNPPDKQEGLCHVGK